MRVGLIGSRAAEGGSLHNGRRKKQFQTAACIPPLLRSRRAGITAALSRVDFKETEKGRPYLPDLPDVRFSFSSCRFGFLAAWSPAHGIGVDLEDQTRNLEAAELAHELFSEGEAKAVEGVGGLVRLRTFYRLWTLKEAALKSIGEGLPIGLDTFEFELAPNFRVIRAPGDYDPAQFHAHVIEGGGRCAALVIRSL